MLGVEEAEFGVSDCGRTPIIQIDFLIAKWEQGHKLEAGQYAFPFEIELPEWLPESFGMIQNQNATIETRC